MDDAIHALACDVERPAESTGPREDIRAKLRSICALAQQENIPIEGIVIRLKTEFDSADRFRQLPSPIRAKVKAEVVSYLIAAYYSEQP